MQLRLGSWLAERMEMYVCSHLFLIVAGESAFRIFRMLVMQRSLHLPGLEVELV